MDIKAKPKDLDYLFFKVKEYLENNGHQFIENDSLCWELGSLKLTLESDLMTFFLETNGVKLKYNRQSYDYSFFEGNVYQLNKVLADFNSCLKIKRLLHIKK